MFKLSPSTVRIIAEKTSRIREYDIKGVLKKLGIIKNDEDYWNILSDHIDSTSASKEAKIEAILNNLQGSERILGVIVELVAANPLSSEDIKEINRYLVRDGLRYDSEKNTIYPFMRGMEEEKKITNELDELLIKIDPNFAKIHNGAWEALSSGTGDSYRQSISSARELLNQVLRTLAPGEMTRRKRIKQILGSSRRAKLLDAISKVVEELYAQLSTGEHTTPNLLDTMLALKLTEYTLYYILKMRLQREP